jgi:hypothetical protein
MILLQMFEVDLRTDKRPGGVEFHQDFLAAEYVSLRLRVAQAEIIQGVCWPKPASNLGKVCATDLYRGDRDSRI